MSHFGDTIAVVVSGIFSMDIKLLIQGFMQ